MTSRRRIPPQKGAARRSAPPADPWMTPFDAAAWLEVSERTMREWRYNGNGPAYVRIEGRIRYRMSALEAYEEDRTVRH